MSEQQNQSQQEVINLSSALFGLCDILRGAMNASSYKSYILPLISLKYIGMLHQKTVQDLLKHEDVTDFNKAWHDKDIQAVIKDELAGKHSRLGFWSSKENLFTSWVDYGKNALPMTDFIETIKTDIREIANSGDVFKDIFNECCSNLDSNQLADSNINRANTIYKVIVRIDEIINHHAKWDDMLGDVYEELLKQFSNMEKRGEFYTPKEISILLAKIAIRQCDKPKAMRTKARIYDPTCGSGSLLLRMVREFENNGTHANDLELAGQEKNIETHNLAKINMILHKIPKAKFIIEFGDTLKNPSPEFKDRKFDIVLANPPYSANWEPDMAEGDTRFSYGLAPKSVADFAFVLDMLYKLDAEGTLCVLLPHGVLFRGGSEANIRKKLIELKYIDAIIGLPSNLFTSTSIPVCALVLKKCNNNKGILFADLSTSDNFEKQKTRNILKEASIDKFIEVYENKDSINHKWARLVLPEEIEANDFNLNVSRYIDSSEAEDQIDLKATYNQLQKLNKELEANTTDLNKYLRELDLDLW